METKLSRKSQILAALHCLSEAGRFDTPPENQGQIVIVSYGCSPDYIYERRCDQSDGHVTITAYRHPRRASDFEPWNGAPELGRIVGVIYSGPAYAEPTSTEEDSIQD